MVDEAPGKGMTFLVVRGHHPRRRPHGSIGDVEQQFSNRAQWLALTRHDYRTTTLVSRTRRARDLAVS